MPSLPCRNGFLAIALKKYVKTDVEVFRFCLTLLDFLVFLIIFGQDGRCSKNEPGLKIFCSLKYPVHKRTNSEPEIAFLLLPVLPRRLHEIPSPFMAQRWLTYGSFILPNSSFRLFPLTDMKQKQPPEAFYKKATFVNLTKCPRKGLCRSLLQSSHLQLYLKRHSGIVFWWELCKGFKNKFFIEHTRVKQIDFGAFIFPETTPLERIFKYLEVVSQIIRLALIKW